MSHHKKHNAPVPTGNQQHAGPSDLPDQTAPQPDAHAEIASAQEQDPKRRIGDFTGTAEHSFKQPGGHNDANH